MNPPLTPLTPSTTPVPSPTYARVRTAVGVIAVLYLAALLGVYTWHAYRGAVAQAPELPVFVTDVKALTGVVGEIRDNEFVLHLDTLPPDMPVALAERTVLLSDTTTFKARQPKDPAVFAQELTTYHRENTYYGFGRATDTAETAREVADLPPLPPEPFTYEEVGREQLQSGAVVTVLAQENIYEASRIIPTEVMVQQLPN